MSEHEELAEYGDSGIKEGNVAIPKWLKLCYVTLPIWGIIWWFLYWNGVQGWLDRGYWNELEKVANTTFPLKNYNESPKSAANKAAPRKSDR